MNRTLQFFKPTFKKIIIALAIWGIIWIIYFFFFELCAYIDCAGTTTHMASCCSNFQNTLLPFLNRLQPIFPFIAYLLSSLLTNNFYKKV
ncbi:hypothetical protein A3A93_03250 [Candidatus Roizmanbacteria bacterium RIFCSPLOWO2_01_FULL_38_12]|uniref:Uncharacterized protein n=1 Tax=Candidatus Roizmanbacteria bacterium RIFCSPLOWO2_01_FULL_38_12 TaxID=1802061 RepID=A0A1F7ISL1_9BACT|nr:MAG: hypothetical protein A2861_03915 [Candidatus Roizmanbacteria bacterium RIFCSPHIGHO2_01_FULL_38_15]OGK35790.1 MAG: hypothetical protein A3F59_03540 [Candidatus Roizmanbacteria bacterium RIFCSPHIGHO2_12_FULL_38_13]OGK46363.1 MAG: hypothetical protein A3A93_03250 [Candidatus Roizmanbacteria bacterium RIFCSPLOWO2_01_FULL_38_12]